MASKLDLLKTPIARIDKFLKVGTNREEVNDVLEDIRQEEKVKFADWVAHFNLKWHSSSREKWFQDMIKELDNKWEELRKVDEK